MIKLNLLKPKAVVSTVNHNVFDIVTVNAFLASVYAKKNLIKKRENGSMLIFRKTDYLIVNDGGR